MKEQAPYIRAKDYDHDDVDYEFTSDSVLSVIANTLASIGVFCALMLAITVMLQVPDKWIAWLILAMWGV